MISPLRRVIRIIDAATPSIIALLTVLLPIILLTALMYAQLYGLFDNGFSNLYMRKHEEEKYKDFVQAHLEPEDDDTLAPVHTRLEGLISLIIRICEGAATVGRDDLSLTHKEVKAWRGGKVTNR